MEKSVKPKGAEYTTHRPEWVPDGAGREFATRVMDGVDDAHDGMTSLPPPPPRIAFPRRRKLSTEDYIKGVLDGNRTVLSQAITLVESNASSHFEQAQKVIKGVLHATDKSAKDRKSVV